MIKKVWTYLIGLIFILGGIFILLNPGESINSLVMYTGIILVITGLLRIISSIISKEYFTESNMLSSGILNLVFGLVLAFNSNFTIKLISILIAIWLILSSGSSLLILLNLKNKIAISEKRLVGNIIKLILGILILVTPLITWVFTGIVLGIILILIGIFVVFNDNKNKSVYKVVIKK